MKKENRTETLSDIRNAKEAFEGFELKLEGMEAIFSQNDWLAFKKHIFSAWQILDGAENLSAGRAFCCCKGSGKVKNKDLGWDRCYFCVWAPRCT
ncbi:hypothetical protein A3F38_00600 [Candidatus Saccharibacteria bacterium RIFCSPHIGHO2_12_FULL_48_21]|nr:MAG: hypothetical protein A3F38_00600 [Candidatus Saccharibacteria bacterium RIFCSPHIGHO2_12_FULL_48_21]